MKELIEKLKDVRIFISDKSVSAEVQKLAFSLDICWGSDEKKYIDWGWSGGITNIVFRKRGEKLTMLRGTIKTGKFITPEEFREIAESYNKKNLQVSCSTSDPDWKPKIGDKVRCIKPDGYASDIENHLLRSGIKVGEEYKVSYFTETYSGYLKGIKLEGYNCTHPISSFEPASEKIRFLPPKWVPGVGDKVRCISDKGYVADEPGNFLKSDGIKVGCEYEITSYTSKYSQITEEPGISLKGFACSHPLSSFEPVNKWKVTFDLETGGFPSMQSIGRIGRTGHVSDHMDYWQDQFLKASMIPADRFGTIETASSVQDVDKIKSFLGMEPDFGNIHLRVKKNRWGADPTNVVIPPVTKKSAKLSPQSIHISAPVHLYIPYTKKPTKQVKRVEITQPEIYAYHTI